MSEIDDGGPAFPSDHSRHNEQGMALRDYFAAKAMQGVIASCVQGHVVTPSMCAPWCYEMADAMLKAREAT